MKYGSSPPQFLNYTIPTPVVTIWTISVLFLLADKSKEYATPLIFKTYQLDITDSLQWKMQYLTYTTSSFPFPFKLC